MFELFSLMKKATPLTPEQAPGLARCIEELAQKAGTYTPKIFLAPTGAVNAFFQAATGRVYVTQGILDVMGSANLQAPPSRELRAVLAHDMGHLKHRYSHFGSILLTLGALPMVGVGAMYLIEKTNEKIRASKTGAEQHPETFWQAFGEVIADMRHQGIGKTWTDFSHHTRPASEKVLGSRDPAIQDMSWKEVILQQSKYLAVEAAGLIPALLAVKPVIWSNEFQADRFAVALTGNKEDLLSALRVLSEQTAKAVDNVAYTPLQKNWAGRVKQETGKLLDSLLTTRVSPAKRMEAIKALDLPGVMRSFHL